MLLIALPTRAEDHITERALFEDATGALDFKTVRSKTFTPYTGILSLGHGRGVLWVRLHIDPGPGEHDETLVLRIRPSYLDEIQLYDPAYGSLGNEVTGDYYPVEKDRYRSLNNNLVIPQGEKPRDIWLKLVTTSTRLLQVQALLQSEALQFDRKQEVIYSLYLAALAFFVVWGIAVWWSWRDRLLLVFVAKQTACLIYMLGLLGYARTLWPVAISWLNASDYTDWAFPTYAAFGFLFDYLLLRSFGPPALGLRIMKALAASTGIYYLLMISGQPRMAFTLLGWIIFIQVFLTLVLALLVPRPISSRLEGPLISRRSLILMYLIVFVGFALSSLPLLGLTKVEFLVFDGFLVHSLVSGVAMLVVMMRRVRDSEKNRVRAESDRQRAEDHATNERHRRQKQSAFLTMLTHELKTPLAVVDMVLGTHVLTEGMKREASRSIRDMNSIIQRCMDIEKLSEHAEAKQIRPCNLSRELADMINNSPEAGRLHLNIIGKHEVMTDPLLLRMIVANLIDNAIKYSPRGSPIRLTVMEDPTVNPTRICIRVTNQPGRAGWPDPDKIFQKYYRHPWAHQYTGSGLGLFLCVQLAGLIDGQVCYRPTDAEIGFELWIPC